METEPQEIDLMSRRANGIEVFLMWHKQTDLLSIVINDLHSQQSSAFPVPADKGMDAFNHPFAYQPRQEAA